MTRLQESRVYMKEELKFPAVLVKNPKQPQFNQFDPHVELVALEQKFTPVFQNNDCIVAGYEIQSEHMSHFQAQPPNSFIHINPSIIEGNPSISIDKAESDFLNCLRREAEHGLYGTETVVSHFAKRNSQVSWSLVELESALSREMKKPDSFFANVPGLSGTVYYGNKGTCFAMHTEDADLYSVNYLHSGAPKVWYVVAKESYIEVREALRKECQGKCNILLYFVYFQF